MSQLNQATPVDSNQPCKWCEAPNGDAPLLATTRPMHDTEAYGWLCHPCFVEHAATASTDPNLLQ